MALTDPAIRKTKPKDKPFKLSDEKGLYLLITPAGGKLWRLKYRFNGKEKLLALGTFPEVSLANARDRRDDARKLIANKIDPGEMRKITKSENDEKAANSFEVLAREWYLKKSPNWADTNASKIIRRLEVNIFPWIGARPIAEIKPMEVLTCVRRIEARGINETAHRVLQSCSQIFRYALQTGRVDSDPLRDLKGALTPTKTKHHAAITEPAKVGELLRAIDGFSGTYPVKCALLLAPLVFVRPGELRKAKWGQFDLERAEWRYLVTKTQTEHLVPLSSQAVAHLQDLHALTGRGEYLFPGARNHRTHMSDAAINAALRRMGYDTQTEITGHGFRAMARTILAEELHMKPEVIEHQLAHKVPDALGMAYNRTKFLKERKAMMQTWADYLDKLKAGAEVIPFPIIGKKGD